MKQNSQKLSALKNENYFEPPTRTALFHVPDQFCNPLPRQSGCIACQYKPEVFPITINHTFDFSIYTKQNVIPDCFVDLFSCK